MTMRVKGQLGLGTDKSEVLVVATSHDGATVVTGSESAARIWSIKDGTPIITLGTRTKAAGHDECAIMGAIFSPVDAHRVYLATEGRDLLRFDLRRPDTPDMPAIAVNKDDIGELSVNPKGTFLAAADDTGTTQVIDTAAWKLHTTLARQHDNICSSAKFRSRHPWELVTGSLDQTVVHWDFARGRALRQMQLQTPVPTASSDDAIVDTAPICVEDSSDHVPPPRSLASATSTAAPWCNPPLVCSVALSQDDQHLVAGAGDGCLRLFDFGDRKSLRHVQTAAGGHTAGVAQVHFLTGDPSRTLVSGGNDRRLVLWRLSDSSPSSEGVSPRPADGSSGATGGGVQKSKRKKHEGGRRGADTSPRLDPASSTRLDVLHVAQHGAKINWLASTSDTLVVADVTGVVSLYVCDSL